MNEYTQTHFYVWIGDTRYMVYLNNGDGKLYIPFGFSEVGKKLYDPLNMYKIDRTEVHRPI